MKNLSNKIIEEIKEKAIKPKPRWRYSARGVLFWLVTISGILLGASSLALAAYLVASIDWNLYSFMGYGSFLGFAVTAFPYLLVILLLILLILAYYSYRQTPRGHRAGLAGLLAVLILFALGMGTLFHMLGFGRKMHYGLAHTSPYHIIFYTKEKEWSQPDKGLLWGEMLNVENGSFSLRDFGNHNWEVFYNGKTRMNVDISQKVGEDVKIIGKKQSDSKFFASQIDGWDGVMNCDGRWNMNMMRGMGMSE